MFVSIRTKLILMTSTVVIVTSVALLLISINEHTRLYKKNFSSDAQALATNLSNDLIEYFNQEPIDDFGISTELLKLDTESHMKYALVLDNQHKVIQQFINPSLHSEKLISELNRTLELVINRNFTQLNTDLTETEMLVTTPIGDKNYSVGYLILSFNYHSRLKNSQSIFLAKLLPLALLAVVVIILISQWVQNSTIKPLINLTELIFNVKKSKNYDLRIKESGNDEVHVLSVNINQMLATISEQKTEAEKQTKALLEQQKKLIQLANYDPLTGLPNRKLFMEILSSYLRTAQNDNKKLAVLFLDIDDFKTVNDSLGHAAGDELLVEVTTRLKDLLKLEKLIARIGGDEFSIVCFNEDKARNNVLDICSRIIQELNRPMHIKGWELQITVSIGIAYNTPKNISMLEILSNADTAMYRAKSSGRSQSIAYLSKMQVEQDRRLQIASAISKGLQNNEFSMLYQPKVCAEKGVVGLEALIRWNSKSLGFISPAEFIPIAEQSGKIHEITLWVINQGFQQINSLYNDYQKHIKVSFNLSTFDILKPDFIQHIRQAISEHQVSPKLVEFEITESAYMENFEIAQGFMLNIQAMGCAIALDDFGTGYSSLSYLTQVQANTLKIDQQFIKNLFKSENDRLVVESIISLGQKLNLEICAEGVETKQQYEFLKNLGCDLIQGYYFSKPVKYNDLAETLLKIDHLLKCLATEQKLKNRASNLF
ncbi:putative bifunctional diguanylate cyclase/phosphodiesterase [Catenovulum maritimum]|uniref:putative bifunctional diguanylate cyclase/phosphodiesterase n=1 Tax=Catenovulum maritimum TaxID=1513271 RepID=UPI00066093FD|nr:bifunctional diguanylate cyclase/phosphodiesterase [Catenovulum maritimum]